MFKTYKDRHIEFLEGALTKEEANFEKLYEMYQKEHQLRLALQERLELVIEAAKARGII